MTFQFGKQKLVKKQSRQSNLKYNFMHLSKTVYAMYSGVWGKAQNLGMFENFCLLLTVSTESYRKIGGAGCTSYLPINCVVPRLCPSLVFFYASLTFLLSSVPGSGPLKSRWEVWGSTY